MLSVFFNYCFWYLMFKSPYINITTLPYSPLMFQICTDSNSCHSDNQAAMSQRDRECRG